MSRAALSLFVFGIYAAGLGAALVFVPNFLLSIFGLPATSEIWIRVNGMFILCLSFYYTMAARAGLTKFIRWSVIGRAAVIVYFVVFVFALDAPRALLMFGLVDLVAAAWTFFELRRES